jgi:RNAse (barnase) inhibitor barstar
MPLPDPDDLTSLVLRTDFSNAEKWAAVQAAVESWSEYPQATYVSDPMYDGMDVPSLVAADGPADEDKIFYLFVADSVTMTDPEQPLLAVDLADDPGSTFRVPPRWFPDVSANLCIANMDFYSYADSVDSSGIYRGFGNQLSDEEARHQQDLLRQRPWRAGPSRTIYVLEGTQITSLEDFWRAWLEVTGSDGTDFGRTLIAFDDALSGPGWPEGMARTNFIVEWVDHENSEASIGRTFKHLVKIFERRLPGRLKLC